jgi:hypothetical protein
MSVGRPKKKSEIKLLLLGKKHICPYRMRKYVWCRSMYAAVCMYVCMYVCTYMLIIYIYMFIYIYIIYIYMYICI